MDTPPPNAGAVTYFRSVPETREELRGSAIAALSRAVSLLRGVELVEHSLDGWSANFAEYIAEKLTACWRQIKSGSPRDPPKFGLWLDQTMKLRIARRDEYPWLSSAVHEAGAAVDRFDGEL